MIEIGARALFGKVVLHQSCKDALNSHHHHCTGPSRGLSHQLGVNCSLVEHLLSGLLEFTTAVHIADLLGCGGRSTVSGSVLRWALLRSSVLLVNNHTLCAHGVLLGSGTESLVATGLACSTTGAGLCLHSGLLANDVEHRVLQRLLVLAQPVLLPGVVKDAVVEVVALHAALKVVEALAIVRLLLEL